MGAVGGIRGDPDGNVHHICTDKNSISDATGGPWTPLFQEVFNRAKMALNDVANLVRIKGHQGPHPAEYHSVVLRRIDDATRGCRGVSQCRAELVKELPKIARELMSPNSELRRLITKER
ncbi:AHH domain-containing protein [Myxococcus sp. CA027]|uniref:AHH domain-containing protein n=1 Tax=Myxococcus sp. CA027 TaxID=2651866 RepID=UPI002103F73D|nr:AHH domain-containing protein [Myxococcus sp. CA027]